jgi:transcriptional regulator with XRE-family HTH domain
VSLSEQNELSNDIGKRLRKLREDHQLSLRELARLSGVSVNALSLIERGQTSPSVSTLYRLVEAMGVSISAIFHDEPVRELIVYRPVLQRTRMLFPFGTWEGLGGEAFIGRIQPFMLTLESKAGSGLQDIIHTGHEFVICLQGNLEYSVEGQIYTLQPGYSLLFAARLRHRWRNLGETVMQAMIVLSGYEEYESPMGFHISK